MCKIFVSNFFQDLTYQKLSKSVGFWPSYSTNKNVEVFWNTAYTRISSVQDAAAEHSGTSVERRCLDHSKTRSSDWAAEWSGGTAGSHRRVPRQNAQFHRQQRPLASSYGQLRFTLSPFHAPRFSVILLTHCGQLILRKITKFDATRCQIFKAKMHKIRFPLGLRDHARGAYSAPSDHLAIFKGAYFYDVVSNCLRIWLLI